MPSPTKNKLAMQKAAFELCPPPPASAGMKMNSSSTAVVHELH